MAYDGFSEKDYENMRRPGSKMSLTMNGHSNIATVVSFDPSLCQVSVKYERNTFMKQDLLDRLREDEFSIDLRGYDHQWIDSESDLYCLACHSLELDHLFVCNHESHSEPGQQIAFHDRCLDVNLGHTIPTNDNNRQWICPMHSNMLQKIDPKSLRRRRGPYDFEFDRPLKKRRLNLSDSDANWLKLPKDIEAVYPIHISCEYCYSEGIASECDGHRPCSHCMKYIKDEVLDMTQLKYISMDENEMQIEIETEAHKYCKNRPCTFDEFENDISMRHWLKIHNNKLYQVMIQEKREKDQQKLEDEEEEDKNDDVANDMHSNGNQSQSIMKAKEEEELIRYKLPYSEPEFVDCVPHYARYKCQVNGCDALFSDKYRYTMHKLWAHKEIISSKKAIHNYNNCNILNHFQSDKPLKYACPYAGCLRGANNSQEIEQHILRHHDITDPTKPKKQINKQSKQAKPAHNKNKNVNANTNENVDDINCVGVAYLSQAEKRKMSKIWLEAKSLRIDPKYQRDLVKHFVDCVLTENLDKFDKTTKKLQREYQQNMDRIAYNESMNRNNNSNAIKNSTHTNNNSNAMNGNGNLPPPLTDDLSTEDNKNSSGPKSLWG